MLQEETFESKVVEEMLQKDNILKYNEKGTKIDEINLYIELIAFIIIS